MLTTFARLNEFYARNVGRRSRSIHERRRASGRSHSGIAPFGYRRNLDRRGRAGPGDRTTAPRGVPDPHSRGQHQVHRRDLEPEVRASRGTEWTTNSVVRSLGTGGWYFRWSFAYAQVLPDLTGGRITEAVRR